MHKMIFAAAAALALSACGVDEASLNDAAALVDEKALVDAVDGAVDRQALEGVARGAVAEAVREALPVAELGAAAAVIDEKALVEGVDTAIAGGAIGNAVEGAVEGARATARN